MTGGLRRSLGLGLLVAYGIGVMVGAGIYVLVGVVIGQAGVWAPLAFLLAAAVALPSALSYAELATRIPEAAGEAAFVEAGFDSRLLAIGVGLAITLAGIISGGAVLRGGVGYLSGLVEFPQTGLILAMGLGLTAVASLGVSKSLTVAAIFTMIEVAGLLLVSGAGFLATPGPDWSSPPPADWWLVGSAVTLCFFAFIGFENLVNLSEEARDPNRLMPRAILVALVVTAFLYALVSLAAVRAVPTAEIAETSRPLTLVWERSTGTSGDFLSAIAVAAAANGILAQIVMAARVLFGLGRRAAWLAPFTQSSERTGTPLRATLVVGAAVVAAALALPVGALAEMTSIVLLAVFLIVNIALIRIKRHRPDAPFRLPGAVPWFGSIAAAAALAASVLAIT